jgi:hypothetical protein
LTKLYFRFLRKFAQEENEEDDNIFHENFHKNLKETTFLKNPKRFGHFEKFICNRSQSVPLQTKPPPHPNSAQPTPPPPTSPMRLETCCVEEL